MYVQNIQLFAFVKYEFYFGHFGTTQTCLVAMLTFF